jgi:hypothetical protein
MDVSAQQGPFARSQLDRISRRSFVGRRRSGELGHWSRPVSALLDWLSSPSDSSELLDHREIVADRPTLGNPPANEPVREHRVSGVAALREVEFAEGATRPMVLSRTELHHQVVLGHDFRPKPPSGVEVTPSAPQELTGPSYALGPARRKGMIDDVRSAEQVESAEVAPAVPEVVDLLNDCLVVI